MQPTPELPPAESGPDLLRQAIAAKGHSESHAATVVFNVRRSALSQWLSRKFAPNSFHQQVARDAYGVPLEAWDTAAERKKRLERLKSSEDAPTTRRRSRPAAKTTPTRFRRTGTG